ncbi:MAG: hypothetical protein IKS94_08500 [Prevotella sp.]|nr:hypothetical protein [Prevotella sp.]
MENWRLMVALAFAFLVFCFWYFFYPHSVVAQERLFVWDAEFWKEYGFWQYVRDFFVQFFHDASLGALLLALLCFVFQWLAWWLLQCFRKKDWKNILFAVSFLPAIYVWHLTFVSFTSNGEEEKYDWLLRKGQWQSILRKNYPSSAACQNVVRLAQFQTGKIGEAEMFGNLTLTNDVLSSRTSAYMMSDVYMYAGMVNMAQRASFEAMASIEDFSMSGRALQRLTETALITGQYRVAEKYISILEKTVYYRFFARKMKNLIENPTLIESHPTYGKLQKVYGNTKDVLFN